MTLSVNTLSFQVPDLLGSCLPPKSSTIEKGGFSGNPSYPQEKEVWDCRRQMRLEIADSRHAYVQKHSLPAYIKLFNLAIFILVGESSNQNTQNMPFWKLAAL